METSAGQPEAEQPAQQTEQAPDIKQGSSLARFAPFADALSKSIAGGAIALYASGFLIVSLYHSKFGFISTDPFRPRILAAGAWFFLLLALPVGTALEIRDLPWLKILENLFYVWSGFTFVNIGFFGIFFSYEPAPAIPIWPGIVFVIVSVAVSVAVGMTRTPQKVKVGLSMFLVCLVVAWNSWRWNRGVFDSGALTLWFFGALFICLLEIKGHSQGKFNDANGWTRSLVTFLVFVLGFAEWYYPHLKASWGGGTPVTATIYFAKESVVKPSQTVTARLIEESDQGFYIAAPNEEKAVFVPRSAVNLIYFGENAKDSVLLK
jgi:hypothetical protein